MILFGILLLLERFVLGEFGVGKARPLVDNQGLAVEMIFLDKLESGISYRLRPVEREKTSWHSENV